MQPNEYKNYQYYIAFDQVEDYYSSKTCINK